MSVLRLTTTLVSSRLVTVSLATDMNNVTEGIVTVLYLEEKTFEKEITHT